jgi:integrase
MRRRWTVRKLPEGKFQARGPNPNTGKESAVNFDRRTEADRYADEANAAIRAGTFVDAATARTTIAQWSREWRATYRTRVRASTLREADTHLVRIVAALGPMQLAAVKPSHVSAWVASMQAEGLAPSYVYALYSRLAQLFNDAQYDGLVARSPCSRRTSPPTAEKRPYVATDAQVGALHDAMPERLRAAVLLAAFAGLREGEVCGLRVSDIDFMRGVVTPAVQWPAEPLKTRASCEQIPIPASLALRLSAHVATRQGEWVLTNRWGDQLSPTTLQRAWRRARQEVAGLPVGFRFHDLRHYYASALIRAGLDRLTVQTRMRHGSSRVTTDTYGHLFPGTEKATRDAVGGLFDSLAHSQRTAALPDG